MYPEKFFQKINKIDGKLLEMDTSLVKE